MPCRAWLDVAHDTEADAEGHVIACAHVPPGTEVGVEASPNDAALGSARGRAVTAALPGESILELTVAPTGPTLVRAFEPGGDEVPPDEWTRLDVSGLGDRVLVEGAHVVGRPGTLVRVTLWARGRKTEQTLRIPAAEPRELHVRFPELGGVTGRVVHADGRPAAGLGLHLAMSSSVLGLTNLHGETAADGTFAFEDVPAGTAWLNVWNPDADLEAFAKVLEVRAGETLDLGDLHAWEPVLVEGRVTVPDGARAGGLLVEVAWDPGRGATETVTAEDGTYSIRVPGTPHAVVQAYRPYAQEIPISRARIAWSLGAAAVSCPEESANFFQCRGFITMQTKTTLNHFSLFVV